MEAGAQLADQKAARTVFLIKVEMSKLQVGQGLSTPIALLSHVLLANARQYVLSLQCHAAMDLSRFLVEPNHFLVRDSLLT
jgi:hypothetical protein